MADTGFQAKFLCLKGAPRDPNLHIREIAGHPGLEADTAGTNGAGVRVRNGRSERDCGSRSGGCEPEKLQVARADRLVLPSAAAWVHR